MKKYPISSYNKHACLKMNGLMIVITLYFLKPYLIIAASIIYKGRSGALINAFYSNKLFMTLEAVAAIPVILLLIAWSKRVPDATNVVKYLCRNGKMLMLLTASLQLCITSSPLWLPVNNAMTRTSWIQLILYLLVILTLVFSRYMKDCFADFPEKNQDEL